MILDTPYTVTERIKYFCNNDYSFVIKLNKAGDSTDYQMKIDNTNSIFARLMTGRDTVFTIKKTSVDIGIDTLIVAVFVVEDEDWETLTAV